MWTLIHTEIYATITLLILMILYNLIPETRLYKIVVFVCPASCYSPGHPTILT